MTTAIYLKAGREKPVLHGHPWIFSGAIDRWTGPRSAGVVADIYSADGSWLARGLAHPETDLAVRIYTRTEQQPVDESYFRLLTERAIAWRTSTLGWPDNTNSWRLIFSEADGLGGLVVDQYNDVLIVHLSTALLAPYLNPILNTIHTLRGTKRVNIELDADAVSRERLSVVDIAKITRQEATEVEIQENGFFYTVNLAGGQKTGFYLDQRENRLRVARYASGRRVLSAYCYTGAFELHASRAGAREIIGIDSSADSLAAAEAHHERNRLSTPCSYVKANVAEALRQYRDRRETFDMIILDPPKFVASAAQKDKGLRAYKDINLLAIKLLSPGGILATFSCSGQVSAADFARVIGWAATDSGRPVRIIEHLSQAPDHPILATFPESEYLKGLIAVVG